MRRAATDGDAGDHHPAAASVTAARRANGASSAASASSTRTCSWVPSGGVRRCRAPRPRWCTRATRSPRSYGTSTPAPRPPAAAAASSIAARSSSMPGAGAGRHEHRVRPQPLEPQQRLLVGRVGLVDHQQLGHRVGADLGEHLADRPDLLLRVGVGAVDHVHDQVGVGDLLQRGAERLDDLVRQVPDEADRVGEGVDPPVGGRAPGGWSGRAWRTARPRPARRRRSAG